MGQTLASAPLISTRTAEADLLNELCCLLKRTDLIARLASTEGIPGENVNVVGDETCCPIGKRGLHAARVVAAGGLNPAGGASDSGTWRKRIGGATTITFIDVQCVRRIL